MYMGKCACKDCNGLAGMGDSSSSSSSSSATTKTAVTTTVSPQISPNFIQQQQPQNSAVNASTSMVTDNTPQTMPGGFSPNSMPGSFPVTGSAIPYYDNGGGYQQMAPQSVSGFLGLDNQTITYLGIGLLAYLALGRRRHVS